MNIISVILSTSFFPHNKRHIWHCSEKKKEYTMHEKSQPPATRILEKIGRLNLRYKEFTPMKLA